MQFAEQAGADYRSSEVAWIRPSEANTWILMRADPDPGYLVEASAAFEEATGRAVIAGGISYDEDRHLLGEAATVWTYRHDDG